MSRIVIVAAAPHECNAAPLNVYELACRAGRHFRQTALLREHEAVSFGFTLINAHHPRLFAQAGMHGASMSRASMLWIGLPFSLVALSELHIISRLSPNHKQSAIQIPIHHPRSPHCVILLLPRRALGARAGQQKTSLALQEGEPHIRASEKSVVDPVTCPWHPHPPIWVGYSGRVNQTTVGAFAMSCLVRSPMI